MVAGLFFGPALAFDETTLGWQAMSESALSDVRGGSEVDVDIDMDDIHVDSDGSGTNTVSGGSFAGAVGVITNIQNNGHAAAISNAMKIEVTINPLVQ